MYRYIKASYDSEVNSICDDSHEHDVQCILDKYYDQFPSIPFDISIGGIRKNENESDQYKLCYDVELLVDNQSLGYFPLLTYIDELEDWYCKELELGLDNNQIRCLRNLGRNSTQEEQDLYERMLSKRSKNIGFSIFD